ncbi:hypothetical protein AAMO2058_000254000 [Amorphochlora amoebiformis]
MHRMLDVKSNARKRQRSHNSSARQVKHARERCNFVSRHPLGIRTLGMVLAASKEEDRKSHRSLGLWVPLTDHQILYLISFCTGEDLVVLGYVSKALCAFSYHDDLWRVLVLTRLGGAFHWAYSWRSSYLATLKATKLRGSTGKKGGTFRESSEDSGGLGRFIVDTKLCSDLLYHSWLCKTADIRPEWIEKDNIERVHTRDLGTERFVAQFEAQNKPVMIQGCMDSWESLKNWSPDFLIKNYGQKTFHVGGYEMKLDAYIRYMLTANDDQTIYLFDKHFAQTAPSMGESYEVPKYFSKERDLFSILGDRRPDHRWLIMGPKRSGSTFHKDPNGTSAWNACVRGAKKWILLPPDRIPCGVHASPNGVDVTSPVSLVEWFLNFYHQLSDMDVDSIECIQRPGDIVFVPCGWWHCVLNLEEAIAITQNYVSVSNLRRVLQAIRLPERVSGVSHERRPGFRSAFIEALRSHRPDIYRKYVQGANQNNGSQKPGKNPSGLAALFIKEGSKSSGVDFSTDNAGGALFTFGFSSIADE